MGLVATVPHHAYLDRIGEGPPRRPSPALVAAIALSLVAHGAVGVYLWKAKFEHRLASYGEPATDATLVRPPPPKAQMTPPPKPVVKHRAPLRPHRHTPPVQPRPAVNPAPAIIAPLPIAPVIRPLPAPPRLVLAPPPAPLPPVAAPKRTPVLRNPEWLRRPSAEDLSRFYPEHAQRIGLAGAATISCTVSTSGELQGCAVVAETPADAGFGKAALKLSHAFRMKPMTRDGEPVGGARIRIPLRFALPDA
ncbi:TonB family protein [Caulobacter sp. KR2-114]|uniref:TonB family protein n=1 Tax=Caulobacter sp. KR2-114 TaxID=3400912 RepID=UPI003C02F876